MDRCDEEAEECRELDCSDPDQDGDGHDAVECGGDDCDDDDVSRFPGNSESCDSSSTKDHDEDCDPNTTGVDRDGDGYESADCSNPEYEGAVGDDCDDEAFDVNPGATDGCGGGDENCDGVVDDSPSSFIYEDLDADTYGDPATQQAACGFPDDGKSYATRGDDPFENPLAALINPGAEETCDGIDNNCDDLVDNRVGLDGNLLPCECTMPNEVRSCGTDEGACVQGSQRCVAGAWTLCDDIGPEAEVCDDVDNDCDGIVDNRDGPACGCTSPGASRACGSDVGACAQGTQTCSGGVWSTCNGGILPEPESCEANEDLDCDGQSGAADPDCMCTNDAMRDCGPSTNRGRCQIGQETCVNGQWEACEGAVFPRAESSCNDTDDDCDGFIDDAPACSELFNSGDFVSSKLVCAGGNCLSVNTYAELANLSTTKLGVYTKEPHHSTAITKVRAEVRAQRVSPYAPAPFQPFTQGAIGVGYFASVGTGGANGSQGQPTQDGLYGYIDLLAGNAVVALRSGGTVHSLGSFPLSSQCHMTLATNRLVGNFELELEDTFGLSASLSVSQDGQSCGSQSFTIPNDVGYPEIIFRNAGTTRRELHYGVFTNSSNSGLSGLSSMRAQEVEVSLSSGFHYGPCDQCNFY